MKKMLCCALISAVIAGCTKSADATNGGPTAVPAKAPATAVAVVHTATPQEWRSALESTYKESSVEDKGDGITKFMAKFKLPGTEPSSLAFGERDAFRKLRFYSMGLPMQISTGVKAYISLKDNGRPLLFLQPYYFGSSWIFLNKISVLVDGELVLEHDCPRGDHEVLPGGVTEQCDFHLQQQEIDALRKITKTSKISVRLTGSKGYVAVGRDGYNPLKDFVRDIQSGIAIYDLMDDALKEHIPPEAKS